PLPFPELHGFNLAFIGIVIVVVLQMAGYTMALYLAGLTGIPEELREAAVVEGANEWQLYTRIILPLMAPITLSAMIVLGHISLKIFDLVFAMAGPDNAWTDVPALLMFITTFRGNQFAKGAAIGLILTVTASATSAMLGSLNGYVFAKWPFPGAKIVFALILFGMFIPYQAILIPLFGFIRAIGLYGTIWGLVVVHTVYGLPITTLI